MAYTYDDFVSAANSSGLMGEFSQADLDTAMKYPEFGLSILSLKKDVHSATTPEQKLLANEAANELRKSYGNYTGGSDGSQYYSAGKIPGQIDDVLDQLGSYGSFSYDAAAPTYENQYAEQQQALLDAILNRGDFEWSKETDPLWPVYKKEYLREGERATANALAQTSAASGGRASSYAVNAATQAGDYYATKLNDIIPTLYQQAYDRYLNEYSMKLQDLGAVNTQEQLDYAKYLDSLSQYNTDRNFAYNQYLDDYSRLQSTLGALQSQDSVDYGRYLDQINLDLQKEQTDQAQQQQAFENAMAMYQLYGYVPEQYASVLGLPAGTATAEQAYNEWYMKQQAAKQASSGGSGNKPSGGNGGGDDQDTEKQRLANAFMAGDHSDATIKAMLDAGYTQADIEAAGYTGDYFKKSQSGSGTASGTGGTAKYGSSWNTVWPRARTMFDQGKSAEEIMDYLDARYEAGQLTDAGVEYIMNSLNLGGYRTGG